jgi:hypothetical protein
MQKTDDFYDLDIIGTESSNVIQITLILQLSRSGAWTQHPVMLPVKTELSSIKIDMEKTLNMPDRLQKWTYKHTELDDTDCMDNLRIKPHEFILVTLKE